MPSKPRRSDAEPTRRTDASRRPHFSVATPITMAVEQLYTTLVVP